MLRFVDAWACREGTPEDDEDAKASSDYDTSESISIERGRRRDGGEHDGGLPASPDGRSMRQRLTGNDEYTGNDDSAQEWIELDVRMRMDEELGRDIGERP